MNKIRKKGSGRLSGCKTSKKCFKLFMKDIINDKWVDKGEYSTLASIGDIINYSYNVVRDIKNKRSKRLCKFYKIERIYKKE